MWNADLVWTVEFTKSADKALQKLPRETQIRIANYLRERILSVPDPRALGQALHGKFSGTWRYRVGDYRIICKIEDHKMVVLVIELGHRSEIYK